MNYCVIKAGHLGHCSTRLPQPKLTIITKKNIQYYINIQSHHFLRDPFPNKKTVPFLEIRATNHYVTQKHRNLWNWKVAQRNAGSTHEVRLSPVSRRTCAGVLLLLNLQFSTAIGQQIALGRCRCLRSPSSFPFVSCLQFFYVNVIHFIMLKCVVFVYLVDKEIAIIFNRYFFC